MNNKKEKKIGSVLAVTGSLVVAEVAHARAGDGQNYTSESVSSGNSGYDNSIPVSGNLFPFIVFAIIIFVTIAVLKKTGKWGTIKNVVAANPKNNPLWNNSIKRDLQKGNVASALFGAAIGTAVGGILGGIGSQAGTSEVVGGAGLEHGLLQIKTSDPQFNEQVFKDKAQAAFYKLQEGWERQDINIMRPYLTDSVLQRFTNQLGDYKARGEKNVLENVVIGQITIVDVRNDSNYNYITVKIDASARDYTVNSQGQMISGSKDIKGFTETWTFLRTVGTQSDPNKQLKDNKCPNCGAVLQVNATGKCEYCGAVVTSGQFDWVVSEIGQN